MGLMFHRPGPPHFGQKVFLATPVTEKVDPGTTYALFETGKALERAGIASELALHAYSPHVDDSRNRLARQFLMGTCTDLFFLDADVRWEVDSLAYVLGLDADVAGGIYPLKQDPESYALEFLDDVPEVRSDEAGKVEISAFGTGFMRIRRAVLEKMYAQAPLFWEKGDKEAGGIPTAAIFGRALGSEVEHWQGRPVHERVGGDIQFCREAREHGFKVWMVPEMTLYHTGPKTWKGHFGNFMRRQSGATQHGQPDSDQRRPAVRRAASARPAAGNGHG